MAYSYLSGGQDYFTLYENLLSSLPVAPRQLQIQTSFGSTQVFQFGDKGKHSCLLLHGSNATSLMWYKNIFDLSINYCVYAIDIINEPGKSTANTTNNIGEKELLVWIEELFTALDLNNPTLIGHSFGAWLALQYAVKNQQKVKNVFAIEPAQSFCTFPLMFLLWSILIFISPTINILNSFFYWESNGDTQNIDIIMLMILGIIRTIKNKKTIPSLLTFDQINSYSIPVYILIGEKSVVQKQKQIRKNIQLNNNITLNVIPDSGHNVPFEKPQIVNEYILSHIE